MLLKGLKKKIKIPKSKMTQIAEVNSKNTKIPDQPLVQDLDHALLTDPKDPKDHDPPNLAPPNLQNHLPRNPNRPLKMLMLELPGLKQSKAVPEPKAVPDPILIILIRAPPVPVPTVPEDHAKNPTKDTVLRKDPQIDDPQEDPLKDPLENLRKIMVRNLAQKKKTTTLLKLTMIANSLHKCT